MAGFIAFFDDGEGSICLRINRFSHRVWIRRFFSIVSKLGDGGFWAVLAASLYGTLGPQALPSIAQMALTGLVGVLIYKLLRNRLVRERPYIAHGGILCGTAPLDRYSFPSGHTLHAVSFTILLWSFEPSLAPIASMNSRCASGKIGLTFMRSRSTMSPTRQMRSARTSERKSAGRSPAKTRCPGERQRSTWIDNLRSKPNPISSKSTQDAENPAGPR